MKPTVADVMTEDVLKFVGGFVSEKELLKYVEEILKAFPIGTVHNWNNGPHKKVEEGDWIPLEGTELEAYYKKNPDEVPVHGSEEKVRRELKKKGRKQIKETSEGRPEQPKSFKHARVIAKAVFKKVLDMGHFSIVSAGRNFQREGKEKHDNKYYAIRHAALKEDLDELKVPFIQVQGKYGSPERSFVVLHKDLPDIPGMPKSFMVSHMSKEKQKFITDRIEKLARKYNQDSVVHAFTGKEVVARFTTQHPDRAVARKDLKAKLIKGKSYVDMTGSSNFYTRVPHARDKHTKFQFNIPDKWEHPKHSYAGT